MQLRGFDSYPIMLGDEMRGERASLGKSLEDVERDLCIKRRMIVAIENCDLEGFPNRSVVAGYVRSYARYLGMDPEDCFRRFCEESGYQSPAAILAQQRSGPGAKLPLLPVGAVGAEIAHSRFATPPARSRFMAPVSLGAITSAAALLALMAGLAYGGYALLQDIQRVGFAPLPQAPAVVAQAPLIAKPQVESGFLPLPEARDYHDGGILAAMASPAPLQSIAALRRDGPISAIDPRIAGVFAPGPGDTVDALQRTARIDSADDAIRHAELLGQHAEPDDGDAALAAATQEAALKLASVVEEITTAPASGTRGIALHAAEDAWVRVRERDNVIFEGILNAGQRYELPPRIDAPLLKAGNAGGLFILVDGVAYGPLGGRGQIARNVSLTADDVRASMPQAASLSIGIPEADIHQRAEASTAQR